MKVKKQVVTCFLENGGKILIMKRSQRVGTYKGKWGAVAGYVEENETPEQTARKEILEETGIKDVELVKQAESYEFYDKNFDVVWVIHPFRFRTKEKVVKIDWEHEEAKWIDPEDLVKFETVPHLVESWKKVATIP